MSSRAAPWLAWSLWAISLALIAFGGLLDFLTPPVPMRENSPPGAAILFGALLLAFPTVGALVASRRPENPIGWIFCAAGLGIALQNLTLKYADYVLFTRSGTLPGAEIMAWISSWIGMPILVLAGALLFLLFPDGSLPSRRWRFVIWMAVVGSVMIAVGMALRPGPLDTHSSINNPFGIRGTIGDVLWIVSVAGAILLNVGWIASGVSLILRWRRASGVERQQIKWFAYAAVLIAVGFFASLVFSSSQVGSVAWLVFFLGFMALPICTGIAILRHRLYDIDLIINRTLVYGSLTVTLALVYFGGIVVLQRLFVVLSGEKSTLAVVASTLVIAALFNPLRRRVQGFVDRRFYRRKYDAAKTLAAFSARLREETDLDALSDDLVGVASATMQPEHASLWLRPETTDAKEDAPD